MLNLSKVGKPLAITVMEDKKKGDEKMVSVCPDKKMCEDVKTFNKMHLNEGHFQQIPTGDVNEFRVAYVCGQSGSGKSTYASEFVKQYKKKYPKNEVYLFSAVKEDSKLDKLKVLRLTLDADFVKDPPVIGDFDNSLCIFDDVDVIKEKPIREEVYKLLNLMLETGRHHKIYVLMTNHLATDKNNTKRILNEAHSVTFFPHCGGGRGLKYLLTDYIGLDKNQIKEMKKLDSRWITIFKSYPMVMMGEKDIVMLKDVEAI